MTQVYAIHWLKVFGWSLSGLRLNCLLRCLLLLLLYCVVATAYSWYTWSTLEKGFITVVQSHICLCCHNHWIILMRRWIQYWIHIAPEIAVLLPWRCLLGVWPYLYSGRTYSTQVTRVMISRYYYNSWHLYHWCVFVLRLNHFRECQLSWRALSNVSRLVSGVSLCETIHLAPWGPSQLRWVKYQAEDRAVIIYLMEVDLWLWPSTFFHRTVFAWVVLYLVAAFNQPL